MTSGRALRSDGGLTLAGESGQRKHGVHGALTNYLHADAISEGMNGIAITFTDTCDVPLIVAKAVHEASGSPRTWADILNDHKELTDKVSRAKKRLNRDAVAKMTASRFSQSDAAGEVSGWLKQIHAMLV